MDLMCFAALACVCCVCVCVCVLMCEGEKEKERDGSDSVRNDVLFTSKRAHFAWCCALCLTHSQVDEDEEEDDDDDGGYMHKSKALSKLGERVGAQRTSDGDSDEEGEEQEEELAPAREKKVKMYELQPGFGMAHVLGEKDRAGLATSSAASSFGAKSVKALTLEERLKLSQAGSSGGSASTVAASDAFQFRRVSSYVPHAERQPDSGRGGRGMRRGVSGDSRSRRAPPDEVERAARGREAFESTRRDRGRGGRGRGSSSGRGRGRGRGGRGRGGSRGRGRGRGHG